MSFWLPRSAGRPRAPLCRGWLLSHSCNLSGSSLSCCHNWGRLRKTWSDHPTPSQNLRWGAHTQFRMSSKTIVWLSAFSHPYPPPHRDIHCRGWGLAWPPPAGHTGRKTPLSLALQRTRPQVKSENAAGTPPQTLARSSGWQKQHKQHYVIPQCWSWGRDVGVESSEETTVWKTVCNVALDNPGRWELHPKYTMKTQQGSLSTRRGSWLSHVRKEAKLDPF